MGLSNVGLDPADVRVGLGDGGTEGDHCKSCYVHYVLMLPSEH